MSSELETLLNLRRDAERGAEADLGHAHAARVQAEADQAALVHAWQAAQATARRQLGGSQPTHAAIALARDRYRRDLDRKVTLAARLMEDHRAQVMAAVRGERTAQAAYQRARIARQAAEQLVHRARERVARATRRRVARAADDLVLARHRKVRGN
jgi:hypothetical protein